MDDANGSARLIGEYVAQGWKLLRLHPETKRPVGEEWQKKPGLTHKQAVAVVERGLPIGVQAGEVSNWLCCVDLDCAEAVGLAAAFLPDTLRSGKGSEPTHSIYYAPGLDYARYQDLDHAELISVKAAANGQGHQFVIAPSVHPTKGPYRWFGGFDAERIARVESDELRRAVEKLAAATLIARHLPDHGRHEYSLALAGYLLRGGLSREATTEIMQAAWAVKGAPRDGITSVYRNVRDTAERIERGENTTGGRTLDEHVPGMPRRLARYFGWQRIEASEASEATSEAGEASEASSQEQREANSLLAGRYDLGAAMRDGIEPPEELQPDVLLAGKIHHLFGPSGSGKTMIALWLIRQRIEASENVVLFDAENGPRTIAERLEQMGADPGLVSRHLIYLPFPDLDTGTQSRRDFYAILDALQPTLIVFDSWASFLASAGFSENENSEIEAWDNALTKRAKQRGIASVILDHVPHDGMRSRGGARKKEVADVQWRVKKTMDFNRDSVGEVLLVNEKDREGWLPGSVTFSVGGKYARLICARSEGTVEEAAGEGGLTKTERKVLDTLREEFPLTGASASDWQRAAEARGVPRPSFYRARKKLVSNEVSNEVRVSRQNDTYISSSGITDPKASDTSQNPVGKPKGREVSRGVKQVSSDSDTSQDGQVSHAGPPFKGGQVTPPPDPTTDVPPEASSDNGSVNRLTADEVQAVRVLVEKGMRADIARREVLKKRER